jgi:hypothetical protein
MIKSSLLNVHGVRSDVRLVLLVRIPSVDLKIPAFRSQKGDHSLAAHSK